MSTIEITPQISQLEEALGQLWQQARSTLGDKTLMRALTLNLIAVSNSEHERELREAIERLLLRHPCRVFLISVDESVLEPTAMIQAQTIEQRNCCQMVLEQVSISTNPADYARLPSMIRPLLVNDIPVQLFWAHNLPKKIWNLDAMAEMADQLVLDSTLLSEGDLDRLNEIGHLPRVDLAWLRLRPWRRMLAEGFQEIPFDADTTTTVRVEHLNKTSAHNTSRLLGDWLRERLGPNSHVQLQPTPGVDLPANQPAAIEVMHGDAKVQIAHLLDEPYLRSIVTRGGLCLLPSKARASAGHRGDLLAAAVDS